MRLEKRVKKDGITVERIIYDDVYGASEYFQPKIWKDFWSFGKVYFLKTALGEKVSITREELRKLNLKMTLENVGNVGKPFYKRFMTVNSPKRAAERIPLLTIANKLNTTWRLSIDVEREYENRWVEGYRYWCPEGTNS